MCRSSRSPLSRTIELAELPARGCKSISLGIQSDRLLAGASRGVRGSRTKFRIPHYAFRIRLKICVPPAHDGRPTTLQLEAVALLAIVAAEACRPATAGKHSPEGGSRAAALVQQQYRRRQHGCCGAKALASGLFPRIQKGIYVTHKFLGGRPVGSSWPCWRLHTGLRPAGS